MQSKAPTTHTPYAQILLLTQRRVPPESQFLGRPLDTGTCAQIPEVQVLLPCLQNERRKGRAGVGGGNAGF